ncbi:MAG: TIGR03435 family protein [Bryobacteraceae bacterium]|jgi:bla regulator protein blaR1
MMAVPRCFFRTAVVFLSIARVPVRAQIGTTEEPQFEVASVKRSAPGSHGPTIYNPTRERFAITGITTKSLIAYAYDVRDFQVSGGPGWVGSEEYDIVAKPQGDANNERILAMARGLLAERFSLTLHRESKEMPVLALVVSKGGPRLQPSVGTGGPEVRGGQGRLVARKVTMGLLAAQLAGRVLDRAVLDRTGIVGEFDVNLEWTPDESPDPGASIFTALQEQLGLKLETQKGVVDVLVVDHVERPSAN